MSQIPTDAQPDRPAPQGSRTALVTGATGYIGGLLVPRLLAAGWAVRVLSRSADRLSEQDWIESVDVVEGDATTRRDLDEAMAGVDVAYFLLHSMDGEGDFARRDRELATGFAQAAARAGVGRIVYLGGLHPDGSCRRIWPPASRSARSSCAPAYRPRASRPPSSSATGRSPSRCCATSPSGCPR